VKIRLVDLLTGSHDQPPILLERTRGHRAPPVTSAKAAAKAKALDDVS